MVTQVISSARTSRAQVPALHRALLRDGDRFGCINGDIGGGKYDLATKALREVGVRNIVYDPYNRSEAHNEKALAALRGGVDTVTIANVLNVIREPKARQKVVRLAFETSLRAYFTVYEGDRSGLGRETRDGWQEHRHLASYIPEIRRVYPKARVVIIGGLRVIVTSSLD